MKDRLAFEAKNLVKHLERMSASDVIPMHRVFDIAVLNSLWIMIAGHRFNYEDGKVKQALTLVHDAFR